MKTVLKIALLCSVLVSLASAARAQTDDRLTAEKEEVIKLAKKFSERYEQTKSLEPLIGEFFRPDFNEHLRESEYFRDRSADQLVDLKVVKVDDALLRRFYVAFIDMGFLAPIWMWQTGRPSDDFLPADVKDIIKRDPFLRRLYLDRDDNSDDLLFSSRADLARYTLASEKIRRLYQRHLIGFPASKSAHYTKRYEEFDSEVDRYFEPHGRACTDFCFGLDQGSVIYQVTVPPFYFTFIGRVNGKLKILEILPFSD